jgi:mannosyltransferase
MSTLSASASTQAASSARADRLPAWWPLALLMLVAAALRFSTLDLQSFWYDEAFTPVNVLHPSLWATLRSVAHTENTPPLWYVLAWADVRLFGAGEVALRWPSALVGTLTVPVAWAVGRELTGRRATAIATAALVTFNPLLVWYSQEARAYGLFVLIAALAMLCFLRALAVPSRGRMAAFALTGVLALLSHYFAVFLLVPMLLWLLWQPRSRRRTLPVAIVLTLVGAALLPLISAQGGRGTQWIGEWPLSNRLETIPQYYLTGYTGSSLGRGVELLVALPILAGMLYGLWRVLEPAEERGALIALAVCAGGVLLPVVLALLGADFLAPRNLVGVAVPVSALIAVVVVSKRAGVVGIALLATIALAFLAISVDIDLSPRLQRGDWRGVAQALTRPAPAPARAISTVELGTAPLRYYLAHLRVLPPGQTADVSEIDETGFAPLQASAGKPPAPGFHLIAHSDVNGLIVYRFVSAHPRTVSETALRHRAITLDHPEVLVSAG